MKRPVFRRSSVLDGAPDTPAEDSLSDMDSDNDEEMSEELDESENELPAQAPEQRTQSSASGDDRAARLEAEVKENYDKYLRAVAELENFKKRSIRERSDLLKYAGENLARDLLEISDNFQIAFSREVPAGGANEEFAKGMRMIWDRFKAILEQHSVKGESHLGKMFDPAKQQALASVPTSDQPPGTILEEFKQTFFFKDKLLRPGQVVVAAAVEGSESKPNEGGGDGEGSDANGSEN